MAAQNRTTPLFSALQVSEQTPDMQVPLGFVKPDKTLSVEEHSNGENSVRDNREGVLQVTIHHAYDIHNICIYGNQDVYAKFSITHCQDAVFTTQPVKAGGRNPVFNQTLEIPVSQLDAVLKCEIWMMSCARNYLEDQLLGFVLVPLKGLHEKRKQTQDYSLTSTDLFYTPAGAVCLSLLFQEKGIEVDGNTFHKKTSAVCPPASFPEMMMDGGQQQRLSQADVLNTVEFPDLEIVSENQQLVSMYLNMAAAHSKSGYSETNGVTVHCPGHVAGSEDGNSLQDEVSNGASFLQVKGSSLVHGDYEMSSPSEEKVMEDSHVPRDCPHDVSNGLVPHKEVLVVPGAEEGSSEAKVINRSDENSSTTVPDEHESTDNIVLGNQPTNSSSVEHASLSPKNSHPIPCKEKVSSSHQESEISAFSPPVVNLSVETEVPVSQDKIVDLYMKSMQQFTEKLAEMKFSLDIDTQESTVSKSGTEEKISDGKQDGSKLYYGSRAFF